MFSKMTCSTIEEARAAIREFTFIHERTQQPNYWLTWGCGLVMVTITVFAASIALLGSLYLRKRVYNRLLSFLLALGIGNLTGCTFFILFPRSMHISISENEEYVTMSWLLLGGCYLLFVFEKLMDFFGEFKKTRKMQKIESAKGRTIIVEPKKQTIKKEPSNETDHDTATPKLQKIESAKERTIIVKPKKKKIKKAPSNETNGDTATLNIKSAKRRTIIVKPKKQTIKKAPSNETDRDTATLPNHILVDETLQIHSPRPSMPMTLLHSNHHIISTHSRQSHLMHFHEPSIAEPVDENELKSDAFLALLGGWANNFIDGMTVGASFADNPIRGLAVGLAILSQHFPNEIDELVSMMKTGVSFKRSILLNLVQAPFSYIGFIIAVVIDNQFEQFDSWLFALAAGNYLYICLGCLVPEMSTKVVEGVKDSVQEGIITMILQFVGVVLGLLFMFFCSS